MEFRDITADVRRALQDSGVQQGACLVFVPHTTAGVIVNEGADPDVVRDIQAQLERIVPDDADFTHAEGNSPAHVKAVITGPSVWLPVIDGRLGLGRWQSIFFCEFDGPRARTFLVSLTEGAEG